MEYADYNQKLDDVRTLESWVLCFDSHYGMDDQPDIPCFDHGNRGNTNQKKPPYITNDI